MKKNYATEFTFLNLRVLLTLVLWTTGVGLMATGTLLAFFRSEANSKPPETTLTFAERVAYQRAVEEVYWRHRIWPKERPDPKPSLDVVISQRQLEKKVTDYLRKSLALQDCWQRPITAEQLQAEIDRMAEQTKKPEALRELFDALGNDPFIVAECLARPALSDRLTAELSVQDKAGCLKSGRINAAPSVSIATSLRNAPYNLPTISPGDRPCIDNRWTPMNAPGPPLPRYWHTAVWTGSEMIVWGGFYLISTLNDGGKYDPATDSWTTTSTTNAPSERCLHTAIWTGTEMIVWGGGSVPLGGYLNTGGRYNPTTDSWAATSTSNGPLARYFHTAVWTGSQMMIWGGYNTDQLNTGGRYDPNTDSWTGISTINAPSARQEHTAIWTESEMIVWGGYLFDGSSHFLSNGGKYDPTTNSWTSTNTLNAPTGRRDHTAVWTGNEMIVWGGQDENFTLLNTGGRYNPSTDNWLATSTNDAPTPRQSHTAIWTDNEMIVWSGYDGLSYLKSTDTGLTQIGPSGSPAPTATATDSPFPTPSEPPGSPTPTPSGTPTPPIPGTGGRYDPTTDSWTATSTTNAASERELHTAVWTGSEMIVWGGTDLNGFLNTGGKYCAESGPTLTPTPTPTPTSTPCSVDTEACGSIVTTAPTNFSLNVSESVDPSTVQASDFTVNEIQADNVFLSNGDTTINFIFNTSPAVEGVNTMHIAAGAFDCGGGPVLEFTCTFRYATQRLSPTPRPRPTARPRP